MDRREERADLMKTQGKEGQVTEGYTRKSKNILENQFCSYCEV